MIQADQQVLEAAAGWLRAGCGVHLVTVLQTWGSSPRPAGSLWALAQDGVRDGISVGSVSGGCLEDELRSHLHERGPLPQPEVLRYGVTAAEAQRFGLPCGGRVELLAESLLDPEPLEQILATLAARGRIARRVVFIYGPPRDARAT
ncbi:hypothetical protein CKO42_23120 [Lamprobacter modestohalophilus]|uniref:XdhC- CoxI domain-containing protein n=1 Tax=Lamprobacter modestohalophilus TaxID=1064514 RepID=A0A9X1B658_9GAMM|nr:XdhC family protein [Lamprobacter modestohalophilus]MBK1621255.1 hypothetical protein [Lamprobacter modestohalophilus]